MPAIHEMTAMTCSALIHTYIAVALVLKRFGLLAHCEDALPAWEGYLSASRPPLH
jgi:hypothetical protein